MIRIKTLLLLTLMILATSTSALAVDSWNVSKVSEMMDYGYRIYDFVATGNNIITVSMSGGIHKIDFSNSENPTVTNILNRPNLINAEMTGNYLLAIRCPSNQSQILYSIDITDINNPEIVDSLTLETSFIYDMNIEGSVAFLSSQNNIFAIDITNPANLFEISNTSFSDRVKYLSVNNGYGYFVCDDNRLNVIDISAPENITIVSEYFYEDDEVDFRNGYPLAEDGLLFISAEGNLIVLDISNPEEVSALGRYFVSDMIGDICKEGNHLCCSGGNYVRLFDVTNPATLVLKDDLIISDIVSSDLDIKGNRIITEGGRILLLSGNTNNIGSGDAVSILNINEYNNFQCIGSEKFTNMIRNITIRENVAYVQGRKTAIVDISDPFNEEVISEINKEFKNIVIAGSYLYGWTDYYSSNDSLFIYDLSSDINPSLIYQTQVTSVLKKFAVTEDHFIIMYSNSLSFYDISNSTPPLVHQFSDHFQVHFNNFYSVGNYIFALISYSNGHNHEALQIYEIQDDHFEFISEEAIAEYVSWDTFKHICVSGQYAFVGDSRRYGIIDISNIENPDLVYLQTDGDGISDLEIKNNRLLQTTDRGLKITDISDPYNPVPSGYYNDNFYNASLEIDNDYIYLNSVTNILVLEGQNALSMSENAEITPVDFTILDAYPNPFNPTLNIQISLQKENYLTLTLHNILGQKLKVITEGTYQRGIHNFVFDGSKYSSGLYFLKMDVLNEKTHVQKITLVK